MLGSVLPIQRVNALLLGIVGLIPIDDFLEIAADAGFFHGLVFIAPPAGREQNIFESRLLGLLQRFLDAGNKVRRLDVVAVFSRDFQGVFSDLPALRLIERQAAILFIFLSEDQRHQEKIERTVGDFSKPFEAQRWQVVTRQKLVGDRQDSLDV